LRPCDRVANADPGGVRSSPQLEVLDPVIGADTIPVMNRFVFVKVAPEALFHHKDVLKDVAAAWCRARMA
jgi:hypothetical protein